MVVADGSTAADDSAAADGPGALNRFVWMDCEMTGLDPQVDEIVEASVVITDANLKVLDDGIDVIIRPSSAAVAHMNDFVRTMHTKSGLIVEWESGLTLSEAAEEVLDYIRKFVPEQSTAPLCGNTIGTDRMFIARYMPAVDDYLHYRNIDVSTLKELARRWRPSVYDSAPAKAGGHRALADIIESINELAYYRDAFLK